MLSADAALFAAPDGFASDGWDVSPEVGTRLPPHEEIRIAESHASKPSDVQQITYNPSREVEDLFAGLSDVEAFDEPGSEWHRSQISDNEPLETTHHHRKASIGTYSLRHDQAGSGTIPGFVEPDTRLAKSVYDYFNDALDPPFTDGTSSVVRQIPPH